MFIFLMTCPHFLFFPLPGDGCCGDLMQKVCRKEGNLAQTDFSFLNSWDRGAKKAETLHGALLLPPCPSGTDSRAGEVKRGLAVVSSLGGCFSQLISISFTQLFWTLQTQICLLPAVLCDPSCLALGTCSQPIHAPAGSLIVCLVHATVQAVLAAQASMRGGDADARRLCLLLCHTVTSRLGWKGSALHGMLQLSPAPVTRSSWARLDLC